jgi:predicted transcriptional regulator
MSDDPELRRLLWFLLGGSRGGVNRARILERLRSKPSNQNQLAGDLGVQYKAVQHHIRILLRNSLIIGTGERYGMTYSLTPWLEAKYSVFLEVCGRLKIELVERETDHAS